MSDPAIYNATAPTAGSLDLAHQRILRLKQSGVFVNITGDINNFNPNGTPIKVPREVYGNKSRQSFDVIGYNFAPTFNVEAVRDPDTKAIAQTWLIDLLDAAYSEGAANKREFQWFDALDENVPSFEGTFDVAVAPLNTAFADKGGYTFTLTNDGVVEQITSPIAGTGAPIIESVGPTLQTVGEQVVIRGYKFTGTTGITIDAQAVGAATEDFTVVDDYTIVATIPASVTGAAAVVVTNAIGASNSFAYTAATV